MMDDQDDIDAAWAQQQECERRRFEDEQALLRADAGYSEWLESLNNQGNERQ